MHDVFLTGTFREEWSRSFKKRLCTMLEQSGVAVYLPERDSDQSGDRKRTFEEDVAGLENAKICLAIGIRKQSANWGFEIGYAYKAKKPIFVVVDKAASVELMPEGAATRIIVLEDPESDEEVENKITGFIREYLKR